MANNFQFSMDLFTLKGHRAVVTGASRGIGQALAVALSQAGAEVVLAGRNPAEMAETAALAGGAPCVRLDVQSVPAIETAFAEIGAFDILVNNAGMEEICPSVDVDEALWDRIVDTNLKGAFFCAREAGKAFAEKGGVILNVCSLTSEVGVPAAVPYGSSKTGLVGMTRALAVEWAGRNIRVNGIGPGYFRTRLTDVFYQNADWQAAMLGKIPAGRFGRMEDLMGAAVFLCSPAASYITGQVLYVDGGTLASL